MNKRHMPLAVVAVLMLLLILASIASALTVAPSEVPCEEVPVPAEAGS